MKRWALLVIGLYAIILAGASFALFRYSVEGIETETAAIAALVWVAIMVCCQAALLVVPVRIHSRRPITKRHLFWPTFIAALSCLAMAAAMSLAIIETITNTSGDGWDEEGALLVTGMVVGGFWITWAFIFGFYPARRDPQTLMRRTVRFLIAGSILELLVAVPTHIIARHRDYCCAGYLTVWGLGLGISVMLFAFGPGVLALFVRRWHSVQVPSQQ